MRRIKSFQEKSGNSVVAFLFLCFLVTATMHILHEAAHGLAAKVLGYDILANINSVALVPEAHAMQIDANIITAAGPLLTIVLALGAYILARRTRRSIAIVIVFVAAIMRLLAAGVSAFSPNDEARLGIALSVGYWTIHAIVVLFLSCLFIKLYMRYSLGWRWLLFAYLGSSVAFTSIVFLEQYIPVLKV